MDIFVVCLYLVLPLVLSFTTDWWFWRLQYIRYLVSKSSEFDASPLPTSSVQTTFGDFRQSSHQGDKIVVSHHLRSWAEELSDDMRTWFLFSTVFSALLILFVAITFVENLPHDKSLPFQDFITEVWKKAASYYVSPFATYLAMVYYAICTFVIRQQSRKYRSILRQ
jgi:hypothetical protein